MQLTDAIKSRRSTKKFANKSIDWRKIIQAIDFTRFTPMAGNLFSLKFIIIENKEKIDKIATAAQQDFISEAGALVVVVSDREKVKKMYDIREKGFAAQQAGAAIQTLLLALTEKKIDNCWVGFFDDGLMREATGVSANLTVEAIITLGIASKATKQKDIVRPELENIVFFEKYGNKKMEPQTRIRSDWV